MLQRMIALRQHLPAAQFNSMDQQQRAELEALRLQKARLEKDVERLLTPL
jgi:hypothetical protein